MKRVISIFLAAVMCLMLSVSALATNKINDNSSNGITARAEETEWRYRFYNGETQKRLWSITYARWLTDWLPLSATEW